MNTCDTCKYWGEDGGTCDKVVYVSPNQYGHEAVESRDDSINFHCGGNYDQWVMGPKFGCIHHEPK